LLQGLWALQGICFSTALGRLLDLPRSPLAFAAVGFGLLGLAAGHLARTASSFLSRAAVAGFLGLQGALAGYWLSGAGRPEPSPWMILGVAALGYFLGNGWKPRLAWTREGNEVLLRDTREWADTGFSAILLAAAIMYFVVQAFKIPSGSMRMTLLEGDHLFVNKFLYGLRVPYTGEHLFRWREVERGDVVVFRFPAKDKKSPHFGKDFIKRAIGLPGDTVEIRNKRVYVNGTVIVESYARFADDFVIPSPLDESGKQEIQGLNDPWEPLKVPGAYQRAWENGVFSLPDHQEIRDNFGPVTVPPGHYLVLGDNRDRSFDSRFWGPMPDANLKGRAWLLYLPFRRWKIIR
jgi:signal peptidase I